MQLEEDLVPAVFLLTRKAPRNNILVGDAAAQVRSAEQQLGVAAVRVDRVTDDMLLGKSGLLYRVYALHAIDLSPETRGKTGIWLAAPITQRSAAVHAMAKFAATLLPGKEKLTKETLHGVGVTNREPSRSGLPHKKKICRRAVPNPANPPPLEY